MRLGGGGQFQCHVTNEQRPRLRIQVRVTLKLVFFLLYRLHLPVRGRQFKMS